MNQAIDRGIKQLERDGDFTYAHVTNEMINKAEEQLQLKLPKEYKDFLLQYGQGGVGGINTLGFGIDGSMIFVEVTLDYRKEELPRQYIVIEHIDEFLYCIDSVSEQVVSWDMFGHIDDEYSSFNDYLLDQINDALENADLGL